MRLSAEIVRDQALAIAGLLVNKIGGPSVKPYQPDGLWNEIGGGGAYVQDHGDDLYRRSLYTFWRRTIPPPSMANFDASARESHMVRPVRDQHAAAGARSDERRDVRRGGARVCRARDEGGRHDATRADRLRVPRGDGAPPESGRERRSSLDAFGENLESFKAKPDAALKYVSHGEYPRDAELDVSELAAYTSVTSLILNLDETVMKE